MTPAQREALDALAEHGGVNVAAKALGISRQSMQDRLRGARKSIDPAIQDSMEAVGTGLVPALAWAKTKNPDGTSYSVLLKPPTQEPEDIIARMVEAFSAIPPAPPVPSPEHVQDDLFTLWPLFDVHWGMHAWGEETGGDDYDLRLAKTDLVNSFERVLQITPCVAHAVLLIGGDFFHADDSRNETPAHKHRLDMDGRFHKVIDTAIEVMCFVVQRILSKSARVTIRILRGNHDEHSHKFLTVGLSQRFRESNVMVEKSPRDLFEFQWGENVAVYAKHGDRQTPKDFILGLADQCPKYSSTKHRYAKTGHRHSYRAERIGGTEWEQLDAFCPPDAYGSTWTGRRAFKAEVFSKQSGRVLTAHDPIERLPE